MSQERDASSRRRPAGRNMRRWHQGEQAWRVPEGTPRHTEASTKPGPAHQRTECHKRLLDAPELVILFRLSKQVQLLMGNTYSAIGAVKRPARAVTFRNELFGALPRRSRAALDGHDGAAAEAQFGTDEFSIIEEAVTHNGQGRPKLLIFVACQVHVVDDEDAATAKCGHGPAQLEDLPTGARPGISGQTGRDGRRPRVRHLTRSEPTAAMALTAPSAAPHHRARP